MADEVLEILFSNLKIVPPRKDLTATLPVPDKDMSNKIHTVQEVHVLDLVPKPEVNKYLDDEKGS